MKLPNKPETLKKYIIMNTFLEIVKTLKNSGPELTRLLIKLTTKLTIQFVLR